MKKILFILLVLFPVVLHAGGTIAKIWTDPEKPMADAQITIFFDVTGTDLAGVTEDIYLWSWYPTEPDKNNWANSSAFAKLTHDNGNVWKITMTPTLYYGVTANKADAIYGLLKTKDGSKVTDAFAPDKGNALAIDNTPSTPVEVKTPVLTFFPQKFTQRDILYISRTDNEAGVTSLTYTITANGETVDSGNFDGSNSEFNVYINLVDKLAKFTGLDKIHITIKDNAGNIISDSDFGLVVIQ